MIGGIPDQQLSVLEERFNGIAEQLAEDLQINVEYSPAISYAALVTAFGAGDVKLAWFGGLTGVQARLTAPGAQAIVQRPLDREFRSVFIVNASVNAQMLVGLKGHSFTFGSESSTSGHLMPRSFLLAAGIDPETDFSGVPSYSGSHDTTWKQVEAGSFEAGALNKAVWDRAVSEGQVDISKVRVLQVTEPYFDYHWLAHPSLDEVYGAGTVQKISDSLKGLSTSVPDEARVLDLFHTEHFIDTNNENYNSIQEVAASLGLIEP
jgi:phosphonate transport system substrate-binding protein